MAQGSLKTFQYYPFNSGKKLYDNVNDAFKYALTTNAYSTVGVATVDPTLASFTEATTGGNYIAGGNVLSGNVWTFGVIATGVTALDFDDITLLKDPSNPSDAKTMQIMNSTAGSRCYHVVQLGVADGDAVDLTTNDLIVTMNANGTVNVTVTA
tara:strand:+ start:442 stop:903 length:462 start_codon:yes stop_codon:yes gene_type:complete